MHDHLRDIVRVVISIQGGVFIVPYVTTVEFADDLGITVMLILAMLRTTREKTYQSDRA